MAEASAQKLVSEFTGTALLLATVVGSGIMAENLAGGNVAVALLGNTIPTGAILYVLITMFGPVSGAHFNPAVTFAFWLRKEIATAPAFVYVLVQIAGAIAGVLLANAMFDLPGYIVARLLSLGVLAADLGLCTYADEDRFFSYRRATHRGDNDYGRLLSAITLE